MQAQTELTGTTTEVKVEGNQGATPSAKDIMARASKIESTQKNTPSDVTIDDVKSQVRLEDIKDPVARAITEKRLKELESGFNKKYEQVANIRKDLEAKATQTTAPRRWTQEELDRALKDPDFISLVQSRQGSAPAQVPQNWEGNADEWSSLTPQEKQAFVSAQSNANKALDEVTALKYQLSKTEEDSKLRQAYPDYDPRTVDQIQSDLMNGKIQATREHLWIIANHEKMVEKAYQLGLQDRKENINEKFNASTNLGNQNVQSADEVPAEVRKQGLQAIGRWRLSQMMGKKA